MALAQLPRHKQDLIRQCLLALRHGRFMSDADLHARVGVSVKAYDALLASWPALDDRDDDSDACLVINNALNEVCYGVHFTKRQWSQWFTVSRKSMQQLYRDWARAKGWSSTGIR